MTKKLQTNHLRKNTIFKLRRYFLLFAIIFCFNQVKSQFIEKKIVLNLVNVKLSEAVNAIRKQVSYEFFYDVDKLDNNPKISINVKDMPLKEALDKILTNTDIGYQIDGNVIILKLKGSNNNSSVKKTKPNTGVVTVDESLLVTGKVVNETGEPIQGASVIIKGNAKGTKTDENGKYTIQVKQSDALVFSVLGFKKKEIIVGQSRIINLVLETDVAQLEQVVKTGYSTKKISELTGSVQKISGNDIRKSVTTSDPAALLKGRATGLYISEQNSGDPTSKGGQIFVRGQSSIAGVGVDQFNESVMPALSYGPLLVVDGVIMPNQDLKDIVTPQEIEDITILKDASAAAIYGSRAAAGVLVVTTKKGAASQTNIMAEIKSGVNRPNQGTIRFLSGQELYDMQKKYYTQDYQINNAGLRRQYPDLESYLNYKLPTTTDVANSFNWPGYVLRSSNTTEVNLSANGGNDRTHYYMNGTYYDEQSTGVQNGIVRKTFRMNLESRLNNRLTANVSLNGILNNKLKGKEGYASMLYNLTPWASPYNADGSLKPFLSYKMGGNTKQNDNPIFSQQYNYIKSRGQLFFGSFKLNYRINDWLNISSTNSGNLNFNKEVNYLDVRTFSGGLSDFASQGFLGTNTSNLMSFLTSNQLNFRKTFGDHLLQALAAMEFGKTTVEFATTNVNHVRAGYPEISLGSQIGSFYDSSAYGIPATKAGNVEGGSDLKAIYSMFSELSYTFRSRYSMSGSVRTDASSSFGRNNRYGTFFSGGAAWVVIGEPFMKNVKWISNLKLRGNYGTTGSQLGDNFLTQTLYNPSYTYSGSNAALISVLGNPNLKWEVTKIFSLGIELGLFKRIDATIDFYTRRSENLLSKVQLPSLVGFPAQWQNTASVSNKGLEVLINSANIVEKKFNWASSFNISLNINKIISVPNGSLRQGYGFNRFYLYPGDDINLLKAVKYAGVDPQTGKPQFEKLLFDDKGNVTGVKLVNTLAEIDGLSNPRQFQKIGSFQPKYFGGLTNTFTYKQFNLNVLITYAMKYVLYDALAEFIQGTSVQSYNQIAFLKNQIDWQAPGQTDATEPLLYYHNNTKYTGSTKYIHDASHVSLRNVRLAFDFPQRLINKLKLAGGSFYMSGDNLYTVYSKNIVALDAEGPSVGEAQDFGASSHGIGIPRKYLFGVQLTF